MIEKCNYSNEDQIIVIIEYSHCHVSIKKDFLIVCSIF